MANILLRHLRVEPHEVKPSTRVHNVFINPLGSLFDSSRNDVKRDSTLWWFLFLQFKSYLYGVRYCHERDIKPFSAASRISRISCPIKVSYRRFPVPEKSSKKFLSFELMISWNCSSRKIALGCWFYQVLFWDLANWLAEALAHSNWCSGAWPIPACHKPGFG
jgi:hypothetical protein